jgi:hypothetical protein
MRSWTLKAKKKQIISTLTRHYKELKNKTRKRKNKKRQAVVGKIERHLGAWSLITCTTLLVPYSESENSVRIIS